MSRTIKTVIIDDLPACIDTLTNDLSAHPEFEIVSTFNFPDKARDFIKNSPPDLLFLDVEMPQITGIEFLKEVSPFINSDMAVVFYSAHNKYMLDALRQSAFDFLLKPYKQEELNVILERVKDKLNQGTTSFRQSVQHLQSISKKFSIRTENEILMLDYSDVLYFEFKREERCWEAVLVNRSTHDLRTTTTKNDILNITTSYVQVNKKNIINIDYLAAVEKRTKQCIFYPPFSNITHIYMSSGYYPGFKDEFDML